MSNPTLQKKLQIKPGTRLEILYPPAGFLENILSLPDGSAVADDGHHHANVFLLFVKDSQELRSYAPQAIQASSQGAIIWIAYPKLSSGVKSDLTRDAGWETIFSAGMRPVTQISIDETWSALRFKLTEKRDDSDIIAEQFSGTKAALRPIYDQIMAVALSLGPDVKVNPRQSYIALARGKQFAILKPSTASRLDVGLRLRGFEPTPRLQEAGNFGSDSVSHKVCLVATNEIDEELIQWLRTAYERAA
jgi:predicted transport protein